MVDHGRYAGSVSADGGLGVLGVRAGQTSAATTIEETVENMRREIRIAREITDKPLGLNVFPGHPSTDSFTQPMLDLMVEEVVQLPNGGHYPVEHQALRVMNDSIDRFIKRNL